MSVPKAEIKRDIVQYLADWQQGDFSLECGGLVFRDVAGIDDDTGEETDICCDEAVLGFVVISQTCDVIRDPANTSLKYVSVCPLVEIDFEGLSSVEKGKVPRFGLIANTPDNVVVDFSRTMSVSKELLVSWEKQRGCPLEKEQLQFARSLERFFGRFAYPDAFNDSLISLRKAVNNRYDKNSIFGKALRSIRELRVYPHASWNSPDSVPVTLIVILDEEIEREIKDRDKVYEQIKLKVNEIDWKAPFSLHEQEIHLAELRDLTAVDYLNSYPLDLNSLSFARRYQRAE